MTRLLGGVMLALGSAAGSTTVWPQEAPTLPDQLARGQQVFMLVCAACHGEDG